ncbi:hypothetical protein K491DRAFT_568684, partial [Lophiostoma macrostomum CBS 122681]
WEQDGRRRRGVKKPYYHFVWPKDGRNGSTWGRTKDILQNKGPDIFVTISADKEDYMAHRPRKPEWSGHEHLDDRYHRLWPFHEAPWVKPFRRDSGKVYDFRRRNYGHYSRDPFLWTEALWYPGADKRKDLYPRAVKDSLGNWWED